MSRSDRNSSRTREDSAYINMTYGQLFQTLKAQRKSDDEIDRIVERVKQTKKKLGKAVSKFRRKVEKKYGILDEAALVKKGLDHAKSYGLTETEKDAFIKQVLHGNKSLTYDDEFKTSKMSRFLGVSTYGSQVLNVQAKDQAKLNELVVLFNNTKSLFSDIKNQTHTYADCGPDAITGEYNKDKHNLSAHIHPLVAMFYLPKVNCMDDYTLKCNLARMVLQRSPLVANKVQLYDNVLPGELEKEFELSLRIARDPNSINYFSNESPISNLTKRFKCQVELWKNVINLRRGRYYSKGYDDSDGITGLLKALGQYDKVFYDGPDNLSADDEGTILKKLLSVFSIRPTTTKLSSDQTRSVSMGYTNISSMINRTKYVTLPVINIRLPGTTEVGGKKYHVELSDALTQKDYFIENKMVVPKNKAVVSSKGMLFFYADRKFRTLNFSSTSSVHRNVYLSPTYMGATTMNRTHLQFGSAMRIGGDTFDIKGLITLETPQGLDFVTHCAAAVVLGKDANRGINNNEYLLYNPLGAGSRFRATDGTYKSNKPIVSIPEHNNGVTEGFMERGYERAVIYWYVNPKA